MPEKPLNQLDFVDLITHKECNQKELFFNAVKKAVIFTQPIIFIISLIISFFLIRLFNTLPDVSFIKTIDLDQSTQIFDINNELAAEINANEDRIYVQLKDISMHFVRAVIAIEDIRFYDHRGIDLKGTIRAFLNNAAGISSIQGGSTITQQLVKNQFLTSEKSVKRKVLEALLAVRLESIFSKDKILEKYLNLIYLGNRSYGIEKAAEKYFKKSAKNLDLAESSLLAGLIKAPELYSPYSNLKKARGRQKLVLNSMFKNGFITEKQKQEAFKKTLKFESSENFFSKYSYFMDHVFYLLRQRYGEDVIRGGGFKVYTPLDPEAQEIAEETIIKGVKAMPAYTGIKQGTLVTIDVKNGYIKAIVGGVDYTKSQFNRATLSKRATGSGFKPIVYLTGLRIGIITPESIVTDAPIVYRTKWNVWCPHNWDGKYMGKMTVRKALTLSRNTPTVRLALEAGIDNVIETARLLGIRSHMNRGYSIALGSAGISPLEVATMYSTLAREGVYLKPLIIRYITDSKGNIIESNKNEPVRVISSKFVRQLNSILIDAVEKGTGRQARLKDRTVAGKTGTTDDFKDIWFSGFTPDTVTTIWMGNDENKSLRGVFSGNCAALWKNFSEKYYQKKNIIAETFRLPKPPKKKKSESGDNNDDETLNGQGGTKKFSAKKRSYSGNLKNSKIKPPPRTYVPEKKMRPRINPQNQYKNYNYYQYPQNRRYNTRPKPIIRQQRYGQR